MKPKELLEKHKSGKCSPEELELLHRWIHNTNLEKNSSLTEDDLINAKADFITHFNKRKPVHHHLVNWKKIGSAAAAVLVLFGAGIYFVKNTNRAALESQALLAVNDVLPGGNVAILTMEDGKKVNLDDLSKGAVISLNGSEIVKNEDGTLVYSSDAVEEITYHTVETPLKGQYRIVLPDGTKVWINSESTLKFPIKFAGTTREIELDGEAYFEVAKDHHRPFFVLSRNQKIEVLGTHFNVKSYKDEPYVKTTLMEGAVKVIYASSTGSRLLKPGEQATVTEDKCFIHNVDVEQAIDWKNGDFIFQEESLAHIMKRVSRWYGISVAYERGIDLSQTFSGQVSRSKNLSEVIACLESTGDLKFVNKDNKLLITKTNLKNQKL